MTSVKLHFTDVSTNYRPTIIDSFKHKELNGEQLATQMKNPPHPGELIADSLEELGVSVSEAARVLGITRQQLHNLIAGRSAVKPEMAIRLEMALGSTADTWLRMQMNYDLAQIRQRASSIRVKRIEPKLA